VLELTGLTFYALSFPNNGRDGRDMNQAGPQDVTRLLVAWQDGNQQALDDLIPLDVLALDEALSRLAVFDPRQSRIVEMLCFGGLTVGEAAEVRHLSERTVHREWKVAKAWPYRAMQAGA